MSQKARGGAKKSGGEKDIFLSWKKNLKKLLTKVKGYGIIRRTKKQNILRSHLAAKARRVDIQKLAEGGRGFVCAGNFLPAFFVS